MFLRSKNFVYLGTVHQFAECVPDISALEEHLVKLFRYRHLNPHFLCELIRRITAAVALNSADALYRLLGRYALSDKYARTSVSAVHTGAGDDKVANARETAECLYLSSTSLSEARYLMYTARHERSLGVVAVAHTVADTAAQRDDILERAAELAADNVVIEIEPEKAVAEL